MKTLSETFENLKLSGNLSDDLLTSTEVLRINKSKTDEYVYVYLRFRRLLDEHSIRVLEKDIENQFFKAYGWKVMIEDSYDLPDYSVSDVLNLVWNRFVAKMAAEHPSCKGALERAKWEVTSESNVCVTIDGYSIIESLSDEWSKLIRDNLLNRFQLHSSVSFDYLKPKRHIFTYSDPVEAPVKTAPALVKDSSAPETTAAPEKTIAQKKNPAPKGTLRSGNGYQKGKQGTVKAASQEIPKDPNVIYGRAFQDESQLLSYYGQMEGAMVLRAEIMNVEVTELRNREKSIVKFDITDYTDSISCKIFVNNDEVKEITGEIAPKKTILIKGFAEMDTFEHEVTLQHIAGIMKYGLPLKEKRKDTSELKRVELHAHTKSSEKDAICETKQLLATVEGWGHKAIAITDHGNVQSFPDAFHYLSDNKSPLKVLYGLEGYLVDDTKVVCSHKDGTLLSSDYVVFSIHATHFTDRKNELISIGAVKVHEGETVSEFYEICNPGFKISYEQEEATGIRNEMLSDADTPQAVVSRFLSFAEGCYLVSFNAEYSISYIREYSDGNDSLKYVDTLGISRYFIQKIKRYLPEHIAKEFNLPYGTDNNALKRAQEQKGIYDALLKRLQSRNVETFFDLNEFLRLDEETIKKMETNHVILIAKNDTGRVNMYRMVSDSNLKYFKMRPRIPKSLLELRREGIIVGSACSEGELYKAVLNGSSRSEIERIVSFYDYLEVQPLGNDNYLIADEKHDQVKSKDDLIAINKKIIALGEQYGKPVCATGDVHFIEPEDQIYRKILQAGCGYSEREEQPPLYLRTTEEMLKEFDYLGSEKAVEIVITNPNLIADSVEVISPVRPDKCPPVIENSDQDLRDHATMIAKEMYGEELPEIVSKRLERELNAIISNGYAVMYAIAHKLIEKSLKDGYLVGSRGSVGSSFAATMYNITEVNPLPPHYRCPKCKYSDFESETVKKYSQNSGWDMPDAVCPVCGTPLIKDGYNIPFETFMGFKGNKEPDIDLNFSDEYQSKAHAYAEVIFGAGQTFKAGTVGTVADKTAAGYVLHYADEAGIKLRRAEVTRLASKIEGVKQSTGQHPGGIIVLPLGEEINTFTPVQHPADKTDTNIITTHFDYHSIDHNLLKLDILGHLDPTMIRMLNDLTGVDPRTFPLDAPEIMGIFKSTEPLGIKPEDIHGVPLGVLGIPEFGTDNAIQMLLETKPQYVSDLIRISGLAHGTNVWHGNAEELIKAGTATIQTAICTRDDIMMYLIEMGVENETAFNIMEQVRKGKVAKGKCKEWPELKAMLKEHNVPDWYLWSCEHIEYMFPKAHAAAYVMMALRIAYCKVFYPLAYYCAYFSIRASGFDYETMCMGKAKVKEELERLQALKNPSSKEDLRLRDIKIVEEMYARGFSFVPIDIYKADSMRFQMISETELMPSLTSIDGMGAVAADSLVEAAKTHRFTSVNDIKNRTKISSTMLDKMTELGILKELPQNDQISFFDAILN